MSDMTNKADWFSSPSDTIATLMKRRGLSANQLAEHSTAERDTLRKLLTGVVRIDASRASLLAKYVGGSDSFWLAREKQYRVQLETTAARVDRAAAQAWLKALPIRQMRSEGWIGPSTDPRSVFESTLAFFNVASPEEWSERYSKLGHAYSFRTSPSFESKMGALTSWLRRGELEARLVCSEPFNVTGFRDAVPELRKLTRSKLPETFMPRLQSMCASCGVAVVFVRPPSGCRASGASRLLGDGRAMIILSFRYLSDDHFWFTFFHEAAHLILHGNQDTFVDGDEFDSDPREDEANAFASGVLIPRERDQEMSALQARTNAIVRFAHSIGVSPGVVVGQMQHRQLITAQQMNGLKRRYSWGRIAAVVASQ